MDLISIFIFYNVLIYIFSDGTCSYQPAIMIAGEIPPA
jgi:hypothetical protein